MTWQSYMNTFELAIGGFLHDLCQVPGRDAVRAIFADYLDEHSPATKVRPWHVPNWLRLAWCRNRPEDACHPYRRKGTAGWEVVDEIGVWLGKMRSEGCWSRGRLDHWGSTTVAGHLCLVNEPYSPVEASLSYLAPLAKQLKSPLAFGRESYHGHGTVRVLLFPPPVQSPQPVTDKSEQREMLRRNGWRRCGGAWLSPDEKLHSFAAACRFCAAAGR